MEWAEIEGRTPGVTAGGNPAMCLQIILGDYV